jgi:hypothetical protein
MFRLQGEALVEEAEGLRAVPLIYARLSTRADPALLTALVRAMPERDEAALALGWDAALAAGWKPRTAAGVEIPVARALVERGRVGEGFALLKGLPREGSVDWELALMERVAGRPVGWLGGRVPGPIVPGEVLVQRTLAGEGDLDVEFTALSACKGARMQVAPEGGAALLELRVDGEEPGKLRLEDAASVLLADELAPGPHRLRLRLVGEAAPEGGRATLKLSRLRCDA